MLALEVFWPILLPTLGTGIYCSAYYTDCLAKTAWNRARSLIGYVGGGLRSAQHSGSGIRQQAGR